MNVDLAERHAQAIEETLGYSGRMISFSKTGYRERHPDHVIVFNANVCLAAGKLWHGDLDLTVDEPKLVELARCLGETVFVVYEYHGRFENEDTPLLDQAVYSVTSSGHTRFRFEYLERREDGTIGSRPLEPVKRPRWRWRVLLHRPRLLRFWQLEWQPRRDWPGQTSSGVLYVGARDGGRTPLLVLAFEHRERERLRVFELTWHPARSGPDRSSAPRPLVDVRPRVRLGRLQVWLRILVWPGFTYELTPGWRWRSHG